MSDYEHDCPTCGKEMRRWWSWWPFCSSDCRAALPDDYYEEGEG